MNLAKKVMFGIFIGLFVFIAVSFGETAGFSVFSSGFFGMGGLLILIFIAPLEFVFNTYS